MAYWLVDNYLTQCRATSACRRAARFGQEARRRHYLSFLDIAPAAYVADAAIPAFSLARVSRSISLSILAAIYAAAVAYGGKKTMPGYRGSVNDMYRFLPSRNTMQK